MADRIVRYIITGDSAGAIKAFQSTEAAAKKSESSLARAGKSVKNLGSNMTQMGYSMSRVALPVALIGGYAVKSAIDFQTSMTLIRTQAGASAKEITYFSDQLKKMGHTGFDATELAKGLYYIRSDGFASAKALELLRASAAGAQVSGASLEQTTIALSGTMRTQLKDVHGAADAMNKLNSIVGLGKFKFEDLNQALTTGFLKSAKRAGVGLAEVGDAMDAMARINILPQNEAVRLQKMFTQFEALTGISKKAMASIGIGQYQLAKDMEGPQGLMGALRDLQSHLDRLAKPQQNAILAEAFGRSKGSAQVGQILEQLPEMERIQKQREKFGTLFHALGIKETTTAFKMAEAIANLKNALIGLGEVLIPVVIPALVKLAKLVQEGAEWFKKLPKPVQEFGVYLGIAAVVAGPLLIFFGNLIKAGGIILELFAKIGPAATAAGAEVEAGGLAAALGSVAAAAAPIIALGAAVAGISYIIDKTWPKGKPLSHSEMLKRMGTRGAQGVAGGIRNPALSHVTGSVHARGHDQFAGVMGSTYLAGVTGGLSASGALNSYNAFNQANVPNLSRRIAEEQHKDWKREQAIEIHNIIELDGKVVAENNAKYLRNHASGPITKMSAEAHHKAILHEQAKR